MDKAVALNNSLSTRYKSETSPDRRREILQTLFEIDRPIFHAWRVFGRENQKDYEQEAFIWMHRALDTFDPSRGAFLHHLKDYVRKAKEDFYAKVRNLSPEALRKRREGDRRHPGTLKEKIEALDVEEESEEEHPDALFWRRIKAVCTPQQWTLLELRMFEGLTNEEAAVRVGVNFNTAAERLGEAYNIIRLEMAKKPSGPPTIQKTKADGESSWLSPKLLWERLGVSGRYGRMLMDEGLSGHYCPYLIDPRDVLPIHGGRIRYLETYRDGLVFPRLLRRKQTKNPV